MICLHIPCENFKDIPPMKIFFHEGKPYCSEHIISDFSPVCTNEKCSARGYPKKEKGASCFICEKCEDKILRFPF